MEIQNPNTTNTTKQIPISKLRKNPTIHLEKFREAKSQVVWDLGFWICLGFGSI
jgi:hypothetical protein